MHMSLSELRSRPHLSVSQLKTFLQCPRKYFLQYVDRVPPAFRPIALPFGSAWHEAIDIWLTSSTVGDEVDRDLVKQTFADRLERDVDADDMPVLFDNDDDNLEKSIALGVRMLDVFLTAVPLPETIIGVEAPFAIDLTDPATGDVLPVPLVGAVDAVVEEDGRPIVWELKTSARRWSSDQLEYDLQATTYARAMHLEGHVDVAVKMLITTKATAPAVQIETVTRSRVDERELAHTAASVLRAINAGVDHPIRGWSCRGCPWSGECRS